MVRNQTDQMHRDAVRLWHGSGHPYWFDVAQRCRVFSEVLTNSVKGRRLDGTGQQTLQENLDSISDDIPTNAQVADQCTGYKEGRRIARPMRISPSLCCRSQSTGAQCAMRSLLGPKSLRLLAIALGIVMSILIVAVLRACSGDAPLQPIQTVVLTGATKAPPTDGLSVPHYAPVVDSPGKVVFVTIKPLRTPASDRPMPIRCLERDGRFRE